MPGAIRNLTLIAGPPILVVMSYALTFGLPTHAGTVGPDTDHILQTDAVAPESIFLYRPAVTMGPETTSASIRELSNLPTGDRSLEIDCVHEAYRYQKRAGDQFHTIIASPFVILGDLSVEKLQACLEDIILPATSAMHQTYFQHSPEDPIVIVLAKEEKTYQKIAWDWDRRRPRDYFGYYLRDQRRMVINWSTGAGTLTHELTHALSQADCDHLPEWFDEGLAALHEHCELNNDEDCLVGLENWRTRLIDDYQRRHHKLPMSIAKLLSTQTMQDGDRQLRYALARWICYQLQQRGQLATFYQELRDSPSPYTSTFAATTSPNQSLFDCGQTALLTATHASTLAELETQLTTPVQD